MLIGKKKSDQEEKKKQIKGLMRRAALCRFSGV
jgi:hypothetical protein